MTKTDTFRVQWLNKCHQNTNLTKSCAARFRKWNARIMQCTAQSTFQSGRLQPKVGFVTSASYLTIKVVGTIISFELY